MCQSVQDGVEKLNESGFESISTDIVKTSGTEKRFFRFTAVTKISYKTLYQFWLILFFHSACNRK